MQSPGMGNTSDTERPVTLVEAMGLSPWRTRLAQAAIALRGEEDVPPSRFGLSSLSQLRPRIATTLWRRRFFIDRKAIVTNLFNHDQTPIEDGWSVRKTQTRDFRGRDLTYDSHNGTDFSIPVGTTVVAPAAGQIVRIAAEFNRGGLKVFMDHGFGVMTCTAHLARALVTVGDVVERGAAIALSGYSGLDSLVTFPWGTPHIHFNVWLDGVPVDPFPHAQPDGTQAESMWRAGPLPLPAPSGDAGTTWHASSYDAVAVDQAIAACRTERIRERLQEETSPALRAANVIAEMNYYPTRFTQHIQVYRERHDRRPLLDLPFRAEDIEGIVFADDL